MSGSSSGPESSPAADRRESAGPSCPPGDLAQLARAVISRGGLFRFQARGRSMMPVIMEEDELLVSGIGPGGPSRGDILMTHTSGNVVKVHRLIRIDGRHGENAFITKGDNAITPDDPVASHEIIGKVSGLNRSGRFRDFSRLDSRLAARLLARLELLTAGSVLPRYGSAAGDRPGKGSLLQRGGRRMLYLSRGAVRFYFMRTGWRRSAA